MIYIYNGFITIIQAEGVYGVKPSLPAVGGNEGVALVKEVCSDYFIDML